MLGLMVCATTGLIISPITWVHHMVWVVPVIIWLAAGADRPRRGPLLAGVTAVLFIVAPVWWVPTSWKVTANPPELHQNSWQLLVGNSFLLAMLVFLAGAAAMLGRRNAVSRRGLSPPTLLAAEPREARDRSRAAARLEEDVGHPVPLVTVGAADVDPATGDLQLVGSEGSQGSAGHARR